eukprot:m.311611 g.311611  ORF g.311611 m.311611 type:complete len:190 (-) comp23045_c0_seq5:427-996(-)
MNMAAVIPPPRRLLWPVSPHPCIESPTPHIFGVGNHSRNNSSHHSPSLHLRSLETRGPRARAGCDGLPHTGRLQMRMKDWVKYYNSPEKDAVLNVLSLEFSKTSLDALVAAPNMVCKVDWIDQVWREELKQQHSDESNNMDTMVYPKVQKYCLMSVGGCYTDWHDFGGSSVWYPVLRDEKVFFVIPPTP